MSFARAHTHDRSERSTAGPIDELVLSLSPTAAVKACTAGPLEQFSPVLASRIPWSPVKMPVEL